MTSEMKATERNQRKSTDKRGNEADQQDQIAATKSYWLSIDF